MEQAVSDFARGAERCGKSANTKRGDTWWESLPAAALLVFPEWPWTRTEGREWGVAGIERRQPVSRDPWQRRSGVLRQPIDDCAGAGCLWRDGANPGGGRCA